MGGRLKVRIGEGKITGSSGKRKLGRPAHITLLRRRETGMKNIVALGNYTNKKAEDFTPGCNNTRGPVFLQH